MSGSCCTIGAVAEASLGQQRKGFWYNNLAIDMWKLRGQKIMVWCRELHQRSVLMLTTCAVTSLHFVFKPLFKIAQCSAAPMTAGQSSEAYAPEASLQLPKASHRDRLPAMMALYCTWVWTAFSFHND
jgi:hypothetical protein